MALTMANTSGCARGSGIICSNGPTSTESRHLRHVIAFPRTPLSRRAAALHVVSASKKLSSRTGRFDSKNRKGAPTTTTTTTEDEKQDQSIQEMPEIGNVGVGRGDVIGDDGSMMPDLPGLEPDFWEGPQWNGFGFFLQYLWAFGIVFALIACGLAVATYNEGATDFKDTPSYKESVQSRELLEEPDASNPDVFESNPTEVAPTLD